MGTSSPHPLRVQVTTPTTSLGACVNAALRCDSDTQLRWLWSHLRQGDLVKNRRIRRYGAG
jgi:hypothetical protein